MDFANFFRDLATDHGESANPDPDPSQAGWALVADVPSLRSLASRLCAEYANDGQIPPSLNLLTHHSAMDPADTYGLELLLIRPDAPGRRLVEIEASMLAAITSFMPQLRIRWPRALFLDGQCWARLRCFTECFTEDQDNQKATLSQLMFSVNVEDVAAEGEGRRELIERVGGLAKTLDEGRLDSRPAAEIFDQVADRLLLTDGGETMLHLESGQVQGEFLGFDASGGVRLKVAGSEHHFSNDELCSASS